MKNKLTKVTTLHYVKLVYRSLLLVLGIVLYIITRINGEAIKFGNSDFGFDTLLLIAVWIVYFVEMVLRFFPSKYESMGCQKQFARNYEPIEGGKVKNVPWWRTFICVALWLALNLAIGVPHLIFPTVIDEGILLLVSLAYGVCDMICILFFCPFHTWFLQHRCCSDCRIYNWDFAMMFTPFVFMLMHWFTATLLALSLALLIRWEITYKVRPERFSTSTNRCLDCAHCPEKLCGHKKQLQNYLKKNRERLKTRK